MLLLMVVESMGWLLRSMLLLTERNHQDTVVLDYHTQKAWWESQNQQSLLKKVVHSPLARESPNQQKVVGSQRVQFQLPIFLNSATHHYLLPVEKVVV